MQTLKFTDRECRVVLDVLITISAYTRQELSEHFDWTSRDVSAWSTALSKVDSALS